MSEITFLYIEPGEQESKEFDKLKQKHILESSSFGDNYYINCVFNYIYEVYSSFTPKFKKYLRAKKEEEITDCIRRKLQKNVNFVVNGFIVNSEPRNQDKSIGYYDLKFEHSSWPKQYLVLECKPLDKTKKRISSYVYCKIKKDEDDGGIYRFLINKYATNLAFGGMLGYIINDDPDEIICKLKTEISNLSLICNNLSYGDIQNKELLEKSFGKFKYCFQSNHKRLYDDEIISPIHLFHAFLNLT